MKLLLATFKHETNTFSPVETRNPRFFQGAETLIAGDAAIASRRGTGTGLGGFLDVAQKYGAQVAVAVVADAQPSGPVDRHTYREIVAAILDAARGTFDGVLLDLHGAMVAEGEDDGEGYLLRELRKLQPDVPVGVTLDMHANVSAEMVRHATVITGYHTYPHLDIYEAGVRAAEVICRTIRGELTPAMTWGSRPMLPHVLRQGTHADPNRALQARCREMESDGVLAASLFVGFPNADTADTGLSVVVCTDGALERAQALSEELLDQAWAARADFVYHGRALDLALDEAQTLQSSDHPIFLLDHCDNCASGGSMDTTTVLQAVMERRLEHCVFYAIHDPRAVQAAIAAGVGQTVHVSLGGKADLASIGAVNRPLPVSGIVRTISDGRFRLKGPMNARVGVDTGPTVVLEAGGVLIVVMSGYMEPCDLNCFASLGIPLDDMRYIILKSRVHWRAGFPGRVREVIECDGMGVATSDYAQLPFRKVRRPIYPIDDI